MFFCVGDGEGGSYWESGKYWATGNTFLPILIPGTGHDFFTYSKNNNRKQQEDNKRKKAILNQLTTEAI